MSFSRRNFLATLGATAAGAAVIPGFDRSRDLFAAVPRVPRPVLAGIIRLDKNENPAGPFPSGRKAIEAAMTEAGRYPGAAEGALATAIAKLHGVGVERVVMSCGSEEILKLCTERLTTARRGLVMGQPSFESPAAHAERLGHPVTKVPLTGTLHLDLEKMAVAARGAGLVFLCNPNNPTSTVHGAAAVRAFLARVQRESPETYILVDEAYHEYVTDPSYATMIPETRSKQVIVSRTFSKVFGMAGLRTGYAIATPETAGLLGAWRIDSGVNQLAAACALASLNDQPAIRAEQKRNADVRAGVVKWFTSRGYTVAKTEANFVFVNIKRDVRPVISGCLSQGVAVGRPFPPLDTHLRLSIGLQAEMDAALAVLGKVLT